MSDVPPPTPPPPSPPPSEGWAGEPYRPQGGGTNGLSIAALVLGLLGFFCFVPAVLALIFGYRAKTQIDESGGQQQGRGMAVAGIVLGWIWIGLTVLWIVVLIISAAADSS
jgi:Domain of unknown function (DUF4190)